jgi:hypothetical protein
MEPKTTTPLLTQQEMQVIETLQNNPDPTSRLRSNYYALRYREVLSSYQDQIAGVHYYGDRVTIQNRMLDAMKNLRKEYEADLSHAITLHLSTLQVWIPWGNEPAAEA